MRAFVDILFPAICAGCGRLSKGAFCVQCDSGLHRISSPCCGRCGNPLPVASAHCRECRGRALWFDSAVQAVEFTPEVRKAIHRFKYKAERALGEALAMIAAEVCPRDAAAIVWVPPSRQRLRERGFDHAALLAEILGRSTGLPTIAILRRKREVAAQVSLNPSQRRMNLHGTFECLLPAPLDLIVIDDVYTTGASLSEAARALKASGAERVRALSIARTLPGR
jgi:competence protein ComFC